MTSLSLLAGTTVTASHCHTLVGQTVLSKIVQQNLGEFQEDLELDFKLFSLLILVVHILSLKNPSDTTLASLSISIYPRWRLRWRPMCDMEKCLKPIFPKIDSYEVVI